MNQLSLLEKTKNLNPVDDAPIFKFAEIGDAIDARFIDRRREVTTKQGLATALDVEILESAVTDGESVTGKLTIFESGHITQLMDAANLSPGDRFILRLHSVNKASRFKKFFFQKVVDEPSDENGGDSPPW